MNVSIDGLFNIIDVIALIVESLYFRHPEKALFEITDDGLAMKIDDISASITGAYTITKMNKEGLS